MIQIFYVIKKLFDIYWNKIDKYYNNYNMEIGEIKKKIEIFSKLDISKAPRGHPNKIYCDICCSRATETCRIKKCLKCPNDHIWCVNRWDNNIVHKKFCSC